MRLPKKHCSSPRRCRPHRRPRRQGGGRPLRHFLRRASVSGLLLAIWFNRTSLLSAQEDDETMSANREYRIKAAYLYQFGRYVDWPAKAFSDPKAPFVIGVLDEDPVASNLEQIAQIKKIQDRPIRDSAVFVARRHSGRATSCISPRRLRRRPKPRSFARCRGGDTSCGGRRAISRLGGALCDLSLKTTKSA